MRLGVDVGLLPLAAAGAGALADRRAELPPWAELTGTVRESAPTVDWSVPEEATVRAAADVLAETGAGGPLEFDASLDGLRGVPISDLDGVGEKARDRLEGAGITTVYDLMMWVPLRYVDRTQITALQELRPGIEATFIARVKRVDTNWEKSYVRLTVGDNTTDVSIMYFRAMWMRERFRTRDLVIVQGDVGEFNGRLSMSAPLTEKLDDAGAPLMAIYRQSAKHEVNTWMLRRAATDALRRIPELDDPVPARIVSGRCLPSRLDALRAVHVPDDKPTADRGRDRLAYDELFRLQLALGVLRNAQAAEPGVAHAPTGELTVRWLAGLPWPLTGAQKRALAQVRDDMTAASPMNRLLQGDVGAGKTMVLAGAALMAIEGGYQAALLAPTEILARQHHEELAEALAPLGLRVDLLVSKNLPRPRKEVLAGLEDGAVHLVVGTHALLTDKVRFARLGLGLVDEQHRFGVDQRALLAAKGAGGAVPDILQATATPIPRTAAISVYGDLEVSILDEKPPGRSPIDTRWLEHAVSTSNPSAGPWAAIRDQVAAGRQAFVVCPRVVVSGKESETKQAAAAQETADELSAGALAGLRIGLATGKQHPDERAEQMAAFKAGELDVLVATTVIEVGVSVPNATVMVILDAGSFGLAQLHQLRGRVGRGQHPGQCWLVAETKNADGQARMEAMVGTDDGFVLSEKDLEIRGPGAMTGTAQAGRDAGLRVADLLRDGRIHLAARADAREVLAGDPKLLRNRALKTEVELALGDDAHYLTKS
ncbi:ATP-dependent DNA helicase RecG [Dietzia sp. 179-F 9C3 NHS]|uniref:ATP-dependent DNA helicase RecG n=1 Tax=Dietzia sp. 179-F 9C3 NHS TaxID=3374295 RepID=UPI00387A07E7